MMFIQSGGLYQSFLLSGVPGLVHGYSTRGFGDARTDTARKRILEQVTGTRAMPLVGAEQVHGNTVTRVTRGMKAPVAGSDGLVSSETGLCLEVRVADCVPILLVDPSVRIIAAIHAGWKGSLSHITGNALREMKRLGVSPSSVRASIGPHIGRCCYTVPPERAQAFRSEFGNDPFIASKEQDGPHLDIGYINKLELLSGGVTPGHIDAPAACTSCQVRTFYSFRKDTKESFGEIIGVIGYR